jgi:hypothetical protein
MNRLRQLELVPECRVNQLSRMLECQMFLGGHFRKNLLAANGHFSGTCVAGVQYSVVNVSETRYKQDTLVRVKVVAKVGKGRGLLSRTQCTPGYNYSWIIIIGVG